MVRFPVVETGLVPLKIISDIHPHTSYTDGMLSLYESIDEALNYGLYEKGAIEHGNSVDEDISHSTSFMDASEYEDMPYTSSEIYPHKFENIRTIVEEHDGTALSDADTQRLEEDIETLKDIDQLGVRTHDELLERSMNYKIVVPHGVELDYNIPVETAQNEQERQELVESYENSMIDFLKEAERLNSGYNYVLLSSHYVNTPYRPRYVKKDDLFTDMTHEEKLDVLEKYREKEIEKIESLASNLGDMAVPELSGELMEQDEIEELEEFVYGQASSIKDIVDEELNNTQVIEATDESADIENVVVAVGAHPTLIERNTELMDALRKEEGLTTAESIVDELNDFTYDISHLSDEIPDETDTTGFVEERYEKSDFNEFVDDDQKAKMYPGRRLISFYRPMAEASEKEENFVFEVNGKGVERQFPSVMWHMLEENAFGSDAHRIREQPSRSTEFYRKALPGDPVLLAEKWLEQIEERENSEEARSTQQNRSSAKTGEEILQASKVKRRLKSHN